MTETCKLCDREGRQLTRHHLIPKSITRKINPSNNMAEWVVRLCPECHRAIHNHLIDHIFIERKFTPDAKVEYLKLYMMKTFYKTNYPDQYKEFREHWKGYLKEELNKIDEVE